MITKKFSVVSAAAALALGLIGFAPAASADTTAEVTLNFVGLDCEGCTITYTPDSGTFAPATVKNGSVTFTSTSGPLAAGYFAIDGDQFANLNAQTTISMLYRGAASGSTVSRAQAIQSPKVFPCWAGTKTSSEYTVRVSVVRDRNALGKNKRAVIAWVQPSPARADVSGSSFAADRGRFSLNGDITCTTKGDKGRAVA